MGLWPEAESGKRISYQDAASQLAHALASEAQLKPHHRLLAIGSGNGEELRYWQTNFGFSKATAIEKNPVASRESQNRFGKNGHIKVLCRSHLELPSGRFDRVLSLDAAYHFHNKPLFFSNLNNVLSPNGVSVITDIYLPNEKPLSRLACIILKVMNIPCKELRSLEQYRSVLAASNLELTSYKDLTCQVLEGFAKIVASDTPVAAETFRDNGRLRCKVTGVFINYLRQSSDLRYVMLTIRKLKSF